MLLSNQIMHSSPTSNTKILVLATLVIIASASSLAACWPLAVRAAHAQSDSLIEEAGTANSAEAATDYQLATWLNPSNPAGYIGLAHTQILAGHADAALITLDRAGEGSEAGRLRLRTLIELGRTGEAAGRAATIATRGHSDADILLSSLAYALAGRITDLPALIPLVSSPETAQRISRASSGDLPLAVELYASGLPKSSRTLLMKQPTSFERNFLLAKIFYAGHSESDLASATDYLKIAVALNPSNLPAHQLLVRIYSDRKLLPESSAENALIAKLQTGRP